MHRSLDRDSTTGVDRYARITVRLMQLKGAILLEQISKTIMSAVLPHSNTPSAPTSNPTGASLGQFMSSYSGTQRLGLSSQTGSLSLIQ